MHTPSLHNTLFEVTLLSLRTYVRNSLVVITAFLSIEALSNQTCACAEKIESFTLQNGLQVVLLEDHRLPIVSHMILYRVGSSDESPGKSGVAHFLEHLMFKGTRTISPKEFSRLVTRNGGIENAATSLDFTMYYQTISSDYLGMVMQREADRMFNLDFDETAFDTERSVIQEERNSSINNVPISLLEERANSILWGQHSYGIPVIGWEHELQALRMEDINTFYRLWYAPNNAVVVITGDANLDHVRALAEQYYGSLPRRNIPSRSLHVDLPVNTDTTIRMHHPDIQQPIWSRFYIVPSYNQPVEAVFPYAIAILKEIFGNSVQSRLNKSLVVEKGLSVAVLAAYDGKRLDRGVFTLSVSPKEGVSLSSLAEAVDLEIRNLLENGVSLAEVTRAKAYLQGEIIYTQDSSIDMATLVGISLVSGLNINDIIEQPKRIAAVTPEDVVAVAHLIFSRSQYVSMFLLPASKEVD